MAEIIGTLAGGQTVVNRHRSHLHEPVSSLLSEVLANTESNGRQFFIHTHDFGRVVGETTGVQTAPGDEIIFAQRKGRRGLTRFVKNRPAQPCSEVTVILKRDDVDRNVYVLITAFIGGTPQPEPWDQNIRTQEEFQRAVEHWSTHALVWGTEEIIPGTETTQCPWK